MKIFTLVIALFICSVTNATTYYISPTGNDNTGNGTIGNPWRSLSKATSTVTTSGDIIHVNAGTYTETQGCNLSRGVSIEGDGMATTIINSTLSGTWSTFLELQSADGTNGAQHISGLTLDGGYVSATNMRTWVGIWITGRNNVEVHDCTLRNWKQSSTIFNGNGTNTNPGTDVGQNFATGNKFYNNVVTNSAAMYNGTGQGALMIGFQNAMEIYGNNIQQIERPNFQNGWPIKYWNQGWLKGVKIYNNTLTKIAYSGSYPGENGNWDFAIEFFNIEGLEIYGNTIQGAIDMAYNYKGAYPYCAWIHDNNITHAVQGTRIEGGIIFEYRTESAIVEGNTINNKTYGVTFNTRGYAENGDDRYYLPGGPPVGGYSYIVNCIIRKNLISNIYEGTGMGNRFAIGVISDGPEDPQINNMQIYNNTITADAADPGYVGLDFTSQQNGNCNGLYVRNNIVTGFTMGWLRGSNNATNIANCTVTHNNAFNNSNNAPFWPGGNPTTYTYNNNLAVNPLFISILSFLLQPLSPCINSGVNVGLPFNGIAPDMGYSEFGGPAQGPPSPPVVGAITQPTCTVATGSVALSGLPASGTWTLTRSPGGNTTTGTGTTTTITGLPSGTYTYTVTDATGTSLPSANIVINTQPTAPAAPTVGTITQPTCALATGSVVLNGLPATGTWTLIRTPGAVTTTGTGTTRTITGLAAGTYTYTVTNAGGCVSTSSVNIVINAQPTAPTAPTVGTITQPTCALPTGSVVLNGLPATGTWTLTVTPGGTTTTGTGTTTTITGLAAGTYTYTVTNAAGCTSGASGSVGINNAAAAPAAPIVGTITQPTCALATGSVVLNGLPAAGTWTLTVTPGGTTTTGTGTTTTITGLNPGTYTYTVTNAAGCTSAASGNVVINTATIPSVPAIGSITQPTCTVVTGSVVINGLPAAGTWTLTRTPGGTTTTGTGTSTTITGLATGTYTYTVTNAAGCTSGASGSVGINAQPASPAAPIVGAITQPTCAVATGSVTLSGLPASGTWTLTRTPGAVNISGTGTTTTIAGLTPGTYSYTVTNGAGCISAASGNVVITAQASSPAAPIVGIITQPTCAVATGSVVLNGLPATGTWTLTRTPGNITTTGTGTSTTITGLAGGTYTYTVTNAAGCISIGSANIVINAQSGIPAAPTVGTITQPGCTLATGSVTLTGLPATGTWTLTRTPGAVTINGTGTSITITGLATGTYSYTVTNAAGCISASSASIVMNAQPATPTAPIVGAITQPTCAVATGSVSLSGLPATGTWTLTRTPGAVNITGTGTTTTVAGLDPGTYTYTITNAGGCTSVASGNVVITAQASSPAAPTVGTITQPTCAVATGSVVLNGLPATGTWTLIRTPGNISTTGTGTSTTITGLAAGTYTYTVTNAAGCISIGSANIVINAQPATPAAPTIGTITQPNCTVATGSVVLTGLPVTGTWTLTRTPGGTTTGTGTTATITGLATGSYTFTVTSAAGCTSAASGNVVINVQPPTPTAPIVGTIIQPTPTVLTGSVDLSGLPATGTWTLTRTPGAVNITGTGTTTTIAGLAPGVYTYTVTNAAGCTSSPSGNVVINGGPGNIAPDADAGPDQIITLPTNTVIVSGSGTDVDGIIVGYAWTKISGPAAGIITNPGTAATSITGLVQGVYEFELRVTDNQGAFGRDTLQVVVNNYINIPPTAFTGGDQTIVAASMTAPTSTTIAGMGFDPDGTVVAYSWTKISGPAAGSVTNPNSASSPVSGLAIGVYQFELRVTDNDGASGMDTMRITIIAPPNILPIANAGADQPVVLPANSATLSGSGTDVDGTIVSYNWVQVSGPSGNVLLSASTPVAYVNNLVQGTYEFRLTVTDNRGGTATDNVLVIVTGTPAPPVNTVRVNSAGLFPNPVVDLANLKLTSAEANAKLQIKISDMNGKIVLTKEPTTTLFGLTEKINMSNLIKGMYIITVTFPNGEMATIKAVKL